MARQVGERWERYWIALRRTVALALVVLAPLLIVTSGLSPQATGAAALALMVSALIAFGLWYGLLANPASAVACSASDGSRVFDARENNDPPRHPARPRAPGLV